ncbi:MAG: ADOP family duplicated permease [Gemmatimonadota bacterium]
MARGLLRALLPLAEREEVLCDLALEYRRRRERQGALAASSWLWRQMAASVPALVRRTWWRGWSGFEPAANRMRPGGPTMESWIIDMRYAVRRLLRRPLYALLAVLTLALGVGGTAAIFSIVRGLLIEPLPYAREEEIAIFWNQFDWSEAEMMALRPDWPGFASVASYRDEALTLDQPDAPTRLLPAISASSELFEVLGATPALGRGFQEGDDLQGAEPIAVLSHGLWLELGADPALVGQRLSLDGAERTVVGVMPPGFWFPEPSVRLWIAEQLDPGNRSGNYAMVGRMAPGMTITSMGAPLSQITTALAEQFTYPAQWDKTRNAELTPVREAFIGSLRPALFATAGAMALILLIACANVAALMLGQVDSRSGELAVRSALGADRRKLTQQLIAEALLIGTLAGVTGAVISVAAFKLLIGALPLGAWAESAQLDWTLFAGAVGIALAAALVIALIPTITLWRGDLRGALSRVRNTGLGGRGGRMEGGLVVAEVALAVILAAGAALLARSVTKLYEIDAGFEPDGAAVIDISMSATTSGEERRQALDRLIAELGALPGVATASVTQRLPLRGGGDNWGISIQGRPDLAVSTVVTRLVGYDYFEALGLELRSGRSFETSDRMGSGDVVVINEALAEKYFAGEDPLGRMIGSGAEQFTDRIIGVVENAAEGNLTDEPLPARYYVYPQSTYTPENQTLVLRTARQQDAVVILDAARRTIARVAPGTAVREATTLERVFAEAVGPARQLMRLLAILTGLALVLGAIGVYGVISHFVQLRKRDWGIRMALGLTPGAVVSQVVGRGAALVASGIVLGLVGVVVLARLIASLLYGVGSADPAALALAGSILLLIGVTAALAPALRASRVDPAAVLREQ